MGSPLPAPTRGTAPQFSVRVYCGQTAGWMNTPLCTEVDLGTCNIVLDNAKGHSSPLLDPCLLWPRSPISATAELLSKFLHCCSCTLWLSKLSLVLPVIIAGCIALRKSCVTVAPHETRALLLFAALVHSSHHLLLFFTFPIFLFSFALSIFFFCPSRPLFYQSSLTPFPGRGHRRRPNPSLVVVFILCYLYCLVKIFGVLLLFV